MSTCKNIAYQSGFLHADIADAFDTIEIWCIYLYENSSKNNFVVAYSLDLEVENRYVHLCF